jgi:hypothetical protein
LSVICKQVQISQRDHQYTGNTNAEGSFPSIYIPCQATKPSEPTAELFTHTFFRAFVIEFHQIPRGCISCGDEETAKEKSKKGFSPLHQGRREGKRMEQQRAKEDRTARTCDSERRGL